MSPRPCMDPDHPSYSDESIDGPRPVFVCDCPCACGVAVDQEGDHCAHCVLGDHAGMLKEEEA
jgi:hypothetical protein